MDAHQVRLIDSLEKKKFNLTHLNLISSIKDFLIERKYEMNLEEGLNTIIYGINATVIKEGENSDLIYGSSSNKENQIDMSSNIGTIDASEKEINYSSQFVSLSNSN